MGLVWASCCGSPCMGHVPCGDALGAMTPFPSMDIQAVLTCQFSSQPYRSLTLLIPPQGSTFPTGLPIYPKITHQDRWLSSCH